MLIIYFLVYMTADATILLSYKELTVCPCEKKQKGEKNPAL